MIHPQIYVLPAVQAALTIAGKTIALINRAKEIGIQAYTVATSDRAFAIYKTIRNAAMTTVLLSIASVLLLIDGAKAIHKWGQAYKDWQYQDFEKVAADKAQTVVATVKRFVKGQRDLTAFLVKSTVDKIVMQVRVKVSHLALTISDRALPNDCPNGSCSVSWDDL